jgi:hypothetical protein
MADRWATYLAKIAGEPYRAPITEASRVVRQEAQYPGHVSGPPRVLGPAWVRPQGGIRTWKTGVTTCPRKKPTLEATLRSMQAAGFPEPDIYVDGAESLDVGWGKVAATSDVLQGAWQNWLRALQGMYRDDPDADVFLLCQDDVEFCRDICSYLARVLWPPGARLCSLYTSRYYRSSDVESTPGFREVPVGMGVIGGLAYAIPRPVVQEMLGDEKFLSHEVKVRLDMHVSSWAKRVFCHFPSLAEHTGDTSTIYTEFEVGRDAKVRGAHRFPGASFSATSLLQRPDNSGLFVSLPRMKHPWPGELQYVFPVAKGCRIPVTCDVVLPYDSTTAKWTLAAVESVLNQVAAQPVIHLIADQVPADVQAPIREALRKLPSIRWYETKVRLGPYRVTNAVFDYMETSYFAVQDSDDLSAPNRLWRAVNVLEELRYDVFGGMTENFVDYKDGGRWSRRWLSEMPAHHSGVAWKKVPAGGVIHGTMVVRRGWFEKINGYASLMGGGDCEFTSRTYAAGGLVFISDQICSWRRMRENSLSIAMTDDSLPDVEIFPPETALQHLEKWKEADANFKEYGTLDMYRDARDIVRLRKEDL